MDRAVDDPDTRQRREMNFYFTILHNPKEPKSLARRAGVPQCSKRINGNIDGERESRGQSFWVRDRVLNFRCCPSQGTRGAHSKRLVARDARSTICGVGILSRGVACGERGAVSDDVWRAAGVEVLWVKSCLVVRGIDKANVCMMHVALFSDCIGI